MNKYIMLELTQKILSSIKNVFVTQPVKLGRWNIKHNETQKQITFIYSNYDHCGSRLCGIPKKNIVK